MKIFSGFMLSVALSAGLTQVALADAPLTFWPATGTAVRLHVTRVVQTADGSRPTTSEIVIRHKTESTGTLERTLANGARDITVVTFTPDGRIAVQSDPNVQQRDPDLLNLIDGLNFASSLVGGATASGQSGWSAMLAPAPQAANATPAPAVPLPVRIVRTDGVDYDFDGRAETVATPASPQRALGSERRERGGFGGGFPGGGYPRRTRDEGDSSNAGRSNARSPITVVTHVSGHASHGMVTRMVVEQSRTLSIEGLVYVNSSGWTFETAR